MALPTNRVAPRALAAELVPRRGVDCRLQDNPNNLSSRQAALLEDLVDTKIRDALNAQSAKFEAQVQELVEHFEKERESQEKAYSVLASDVGGAWRAISVFHEELSLFRSKLTKLEAANIDLLERKIEAERAARMELTQAVDAHHAAIATAAQDIERHSREAKQFKTEVYNWVDLEVLNVYGRQMDETSMRVEAIAAAKPVISHQYDQKSTPPRRSSWVTLESEVIEPAPRASKAGDRVEERPETAHAFNLTRPLAFPQALPKQEAIDRMSLFTELVTNALGTSGASRVRCRAVAP